MNKKFLEFISTPKKVLWTAAGIGVVMLLLVQIFPVFYRDSVSYMGSVSSVWLGNWRIAFNLRCVPLLFVFGSLFMPLGLDANQALSLASSLFAIGMLYPGYRVLSYYMDRRWAAWGSVLFFLMPPVFRVSFAPLTDSARWFFLFLCWMMILSYLEAPKIRKALLLGVFFAMLALVRSEGIVFAGLFSLWFFLELWRGAGWRCGLRRWSKCLLPLAAAWGIMFLLLIPRLVQMHEVSGVYSLDTRQTWAVKSVMTRLFPGKFDFRKSDPLTSYSLRAEHKRKTFFLLDKDWSRRYWKNVFAGNYGPYAVFTILGIFLLAYRKKWRRDHTLMVVFFAVNAGTYMAMRSNAGRYFYLSTFFFMPFTLYGLESAWAWFEKKVPERCRIPVCRVLPLVFCAALALTLLSGMKNLFPCGEEHYGKIGRMMRELSRGMATRSRTEHPVYLIIGDNLGWGFHCNGNELDPADLRLPENESIRRILTDGTSSGYCAFAVDPLDGTAVLKPDYVLVSDTDETSVLFRDCGELLEEIPQSIDSRVMIYKVKSPPEAKESL